MDNSKDDFYYLGKIEQDLLFIHEHTKELTQEELEEDEVLVDSIMFRLIQIAENGDRLADEFKKSHPEIPWRSIKGMRNVIVHDYGIVDLSIVYLTVTESVPELLIMLNKIYKK